MKEKIGKSTIKNEVTNLIYYIIGNKYKQNPQNLFYQSALFPNPIPFNLNDEFAENTLKTSRDTKVTDLNNMNEEFEIKTNSYDDISSEIPRINTKSLSNTSKKRIKYLGTQLKFFSKKLQVIF